MSDLVPDPIEKELLQLRPARPPEDFIDRLVNARARKQEHRWQIRFELLGKWRSWIGWAAAGFALLAVFAGMLSWPPRQTPVHEQAQSSPMESPLRADNVEIDQQLVASFDTITKLPNGEPVRLQCREWLDAVVLRDSVRGVVIERQAPRFEVVPVRFETY